MGALTLCLVAGAAKADAQQTDQSKQGSQAASSTGAAKATSAPREMKTMQLGNGSYIRYEVMPDDDQQPPGQLVVMHFDAPAKPAPAPTAAEAQAADDEQAQTQARAAAKSAQRSRAACDDLRMRLAARLLELRGVQVDPDVAAWIQRNTYFTADGVPALQVFADPLFFSAMQSDSHARAIATDLARCEGTTRKG
jgi:hypothetical protein